MYRWRTFALTLTTLAILLSTGCRRRNEYDKNANIPRYVNPSPGELRDVYGLMITIHGCPLETVEAMLAKNDLPNIKKYIIDRGAKVKYGVCCFPSLSSPNGPAIFLGRFPGHIGIPGLQWVDRRPHFYIRNYLGVDFKKANEDFYSGRATEYDLEINREGAPVPLCAMLRPYTSATFQEFFSAGASEQKYFIASILKDEVLAGTRTRTDTKTLKEVINCYNRPYDKIPRMICIDLLGMDITGHYKNPMHPKAQFILKNIDRHIGEIVAQLKKRKLWEKTYIALFSDHGQKNLSRYRKRKKMVATLYLKKFGLLPMRESRNGNFNVFSTSSGANIAMLYFADHNASAIGVSYSWKKRPTLNRLQNYAVTHKRKIDIVATLLADDRIKFVLSKGDGGNVHVFTKDSEAIITRRIFMGEPFFHYKLIRGKSDPFEYLNSPKLKDWVTSGIYHTDEDWLNKTADSKYPYAVPNVFQIFDNRRAGDLIVVGADHVLMKNAVYNSTHGALSPADILVPMFFSGPDIKRQEIYAARVIDLYPTWLRIFGIKVPFQNIDGRPLDSILPESLIKNTNPKEARQKKLAHLVQAIWALERSDPSKTANPGHNAHFIVLKNAPRADLETLLKYWESESARLPSDYKVRIDRYLEIIRTVLTHKK